MEYKKIDKEDMDGSPAPGPENGIEIVNNFN